MLSLMVDYIQIITGSPNTPSNVFKEKLRHSITEMYFSDNKPITENNEKNNQSRYYRTRQI